MSRKGKQVANRNEDITEIGIKTRNVLDFINYRKELAIIIWGYHYYSGAPAEIFPRGGKSFTETFIHFTYQCMRTA